MSALSISVQYVAPNGSDTNDGLSWATAKKSVLGAYDALPDNPGSAGGGQSISARAAASALTKIPRIRGCGFSGIRTLSLQIRRLVGDVRGLFG